MKGIATCEDCLIELWKTHCENCEAVKPIVEELEKEGFIFEKHNLGSFEGERLWADYEEQIDKNSRKMGYETGYIYTPTFINPKTREVLAFSHRPPTKEELIRLKDGEEVKINISKA